MICGIWSVIDCFTQAKKRLHIEHGRLKNSNSAQFSSTGCKWRRTDKFESRMRMNAPIKSMIADSMQNISQIIYQTIIDNNSKQFQS